MNEARLEYLRRKHRKLPRDEQRARGPVPVVGAQTTIAVAKTVRARLVRLTNGRQIGPMIRWAYALGRSALMARLSAGDRWDKSDLRGGRGKLVSVALPVSYIRGWPKGMECSHGAACRLAIDVGLVLLECEYALHKWVELLDERSYDIIAAEHHPERYCAPGPWTDTNPEPTIERLRSGKTWLG